jgi:hypothetical protein
MNGTNGTCLNDGQGCTPQVLSVEIPVHLESIDDEGVSSLDEGVPSLDEGVPSLDEVLICPVSLL